MKDDLQLEKFTEEIMELDWGCGCCSVASTDELKAEIQEILKKFAEQVRS